MNENLINRLKKDGDELDQLAERRLTESARVQPLWAQRSQRKLNHRWFWGLAAALTLTVGLVTTLNESLITPEPQSVNLVVQNPIMLMDEQLRAPLKAEQQAIIDDLKTLKRRFISI